MMAELSPIAKKARGYGLSPLPVGSPGWKMELPPNEKGEPQEPLDLKKKPTHIKNGKPSLLSWNRYKNERPMNDPEIDREFEGIEYIGFACGKTSGNLEVVDFDLAGIFDLWVEVLTAIGGSEILSRLTIQNTQREGCKHVLFRCECIEGNQKLARYYDQADLDDHGQPKIKASIETRGQGGYIVGFPSPGYTMHQGSFATIPTITPEDRELLLRAAKLLDAVADDPKPEPKGAKPNAGASGLRPGDDFNAKANWYDILSPSGGRMVLERGDRQFWCRPGKTGRDWSATTGNGYGKDLLKVFTSNWPPFEPDGVYSKFSAYALLNYGGDYAAAASALSRQDYGDRPANPALGPAAAVVANPVLGPVAAEEGMVQTHVSRFRFLTVDDLAQTPEKPMLIRNLLGEHDLWMIFGASGAAKTFTVLDFLVCCAVGGIWSGQFECERPLKVAYCYGEGKYGVPRRLMACLAKNGLEMTDVRENMRFLDDVPQLYQTEGERSIWEFVKQCEAEEFLPDIFVLDTKSRATLGGKEEDNREAAMVCDLLGQVADRLGCAPGFVHHTGWNNDNPRGASAYMGAMDLMIRQELDQETKHGKIALYKGKDIRPFEPVPFRLVDQDGTAVVDFTAGFASFDGKALALAMITMRDDPSRYWAPSELASGDITADAMRMALKRESIRPGGDVIWNGLKNPAKYRMRGPNG